MSMEKVGRRLRPTQKQDCETLFVLAGHLAEQILEDLLCACLQTAHT